MSIRLPRNKKLPPRVHAKNPVKLLRGDILQMTKGHNTAVGGDDVELAKMGDGLGHERRDLVHVRDVGFYGDGVGAGAEGFDFGDEGFGWRG